jgi:hypothetical protein
VLICFPKMPLSPLHEDAHLALAVLPPQMFICAATIVVVDVSSVDGAAAA